MDRKIKLSLLITAGMVVLAGAAYLAMLYIFPGATIAGSLGLITGGGKGGVRIEVQRSPELPATDPNAEGTITAMQDNSLTISQSADGQEGGGQSIEVVVNHTTLLYRDATLDNTSKAEIIKGGSRTLTMIVQPARIEDIAVGDILQAWGDLRGGRLIATEVLVLKNIAPLAQPGGKGQ